MVDARIMNLLKGFLMPPSPALADRCRPRNDFSNECRVLFIGSGLSTALGMPSWRTLLSDLARKYISNEGIRLSIFEFLQDPGHEYDAAKKLNDVLGENNLQHLVGKIMRAEQDKIINSGGLRESVQRISQIANAGIVTTNWDTLLTERTGIPALVWPTDYEEASPAAYCGSTSEAG